MVKNKKQIVKEFSKISWLKNKIIKHKNDTTLKVFNTNEIDIWYQRPYELLHTYQELYINQIYNFYTENPAPIIIDCGSNIGLSMIYFKKLYPQSTIYCFEADKNNFNILDKNIQHNRFTNVIAKNEAVWNKNGVIQFSSLASEASRIQTNNTPANTNTIDINCINFSEFLQSFSQIDFIKIDIEGAEFEVMENCQNQLHKVNNMFVEYHGKVHETYKLERILSILKNNHFNVYVKMAFDGLKYPYIDKTTDTQFDVQLNLFCYR